MNMTELSRMLMVSNGNVTGIIDRLAAEKLVLRQAPANDRRSYIVRLTPKGAAQFAVIAKAHEGWVDELLAGFDAAEAEELDSPTRRARQVDVRSAETSSHEYDGYQAEALQLARRRQGRASSRCRGPNAKTR